MSDSQRLKITPAPGRLVVRPFDLLASDSRLVLPDNVQGGKTTTGLVVATNYKPVSDELPDDFIAPSSFASIGMQVVFPAFAGTDITLNEPKPDNPRFRQKYVVIREADVIAAIEFDGDPLEIAAEPRSLGA
jgi:co-chaperonin GroES (HSP10)